MFDPKKYHFVDSGKPSSSPRIGDSAVLFRTMPLLYGKRNLALNSEAGWQIKREGRFHHIHQPACYCSTHALTSFAEVLSHMHHGMIKALEERVPASELHSVYVSKLCKLGAFEINHVDRLLHIESSEAIKYDTRIRGAAVVSPLHEYAPLQEFATKVRACATRYRGMIYPSARYRSDRSYDMCCVFFYNESAIIKTFRSLQVKLSLVGEEHYAHGVPGCDPLSEKVHPFIGHYEFSNPGAFDKLRKEKWFNPSDIKYNGFVRFRRDCG